MKVNIKDLIRRTAKCLKGCSTIIDIEILWCEPVGGDYPEGFDRNREDTYPEMVDKRQSVCAGVAEIKIGGASRGNTDMEEGDLRINIYDDFVFEGKENVRFLVNGRTYSLKPTGRNPADGGGLMTVDGPAYVTVCARLCP